MLKHSQCGGHHIRRLASTLPKRREKGMKSVVKKKRLEQHNKANAIHSRNPGLGGGHPAVSRGFEENLNINRQ